MTTQDRADIVRILENAKGDDLYRARRAFANMTQRQMGEPYGQNPTTPAQILADYQRHEDHIKDLIVAVQNA